MKKILASLFILLSIVTFSAEKIAIERVEVKEEKVEDVKEGEHHPHLKEKIKAKAEKVKAGVR